MLTTQAAHPPDPIPGSETPDLGPLSTLDPDAETDLDPPLDLAATSDPCAPEDLRSASVGVDEPAVDLSEATDEALVRAARLCDDVAFSVLVDRHGPALLQFARRMMDDEHEAVDAVQETFISAWRGLPGYRGKSAFRTWLYRLLHRRVVDLHRVRRAVPIDDELLDAFHRPSTDDPLQHLLGAELMAALDVALRELPWNQRAAWLLAEVHGMTYDEIATALAITPGAVRGHLHRGRRTLATRMERWR
ncbi:RNA polymerase sigma factor [Solicola sp. PLA-1-18]|uniref:RNA polymerase sigma factor n=1 Tax=Solicola sp. PLA-1-18 TaxID=3380532 RepID=UPI003B77F079